MRPRLLDLFCGAGGAAMGYHRAGFEVVGVDPSAKRGRMTVFLQDPDVTLWHGDVIDTLRELPDGSVHCVVTSPPYWGLRCYGVDGQLGLEPTPDLYVARMVDVFREVRRVLRGDGTCWLNIGDTYNSRLNGSHGGWNGSTPEPQRTMNEGAPVEISAPGLKPKDLCGVPWRLAFALQADGWYLRSDIIWSKPNPMPESVTDRPTKSHEYVFLLTKSPRYYFDQEAVRETATWDRWGDQTNPKYIEQDGMHAARMKPRTREELQARAAIGRNVRSVWEIASQPYPEAHFATFPEELARRCILAGTSERGCCPECGAPWVREVESEIVGTPRHEQGHYANHDGADGTNSYLSKTAVHGSRVTTTLGWKPTCGCEAGPLQDVTYDGKRAHMPVPAVVLDPFVGSGTVPHVARKHGRHAIGVDLNPQYLELAARRLSQLSLLAAGRETT